MTHLTRKHYKPGQETFEIDTNIPLPEPYVNQKTLLNTFATLEVGESFFIPEMGSPASYNHIFGNARYFEKRYQEDFNVVIRFEADDDGLVGLRVWRTEDEPVIRDRVKK